MSTRRGILAMLGVGPVAIASIEPQGISGTPFGGNAISLGCAGAVGDMSEAVDVRATLSAAVAKRHLQKARSEDRAMHRWTRADDGFAMGLAKRLVGIST